MKNYLQVLALQANHESLGSVVDNGDIRGLA